MKLADLDQKIPILSAAPNLKGKKNNKQRFYYLSEQLPEQLQEERRYAQFWIQDNKKKPKELQKDMKIHKNKLRLDNRPYVKKVMPPNAAEILKVDVEEMFQLKQVNLTYGDSHEIQESEFISYAAKVTKAEDVRKAYRQLRIKYSDATHIMSAFRLNPPNGPLNQESSDDGEFGGGRVLMKLLMENDIVNTAVFVVRYYGGKHIGADRFDIINRLGRKALKNAHLLYTTTRGPLTRSQSVASKYPSNKQVKKSDRGITTPLTSEVETEGLMTADEELSSRQNSDGSDAESNSNDSAPQVVINFKQQQEARLQQESNEEADNEDSDQENKSA